MDDRDAALCTQLEGGHIDDVALIQLIGVLSHRRLGPDTIGGIKLTNLRTDDPRFVALHTRNANLTRRAFELIKASRWFEEDRWPDPPRKAEKVLGLPSGGLGFRRWVDHRLENMNVLDAIEHGREA